MRTAVLRAERQSDHLEITRRAPVEVEIRARTITAALMLVSLALVLFSYAQDLVAFAFPDAGIPRIWRLDVDVEVSVPTWFSSALILINGLLLGLIANAAFRQGGVWRWHWLVLALIFVGLSVDEAVSLHEGLSGPVKRMLGTGGVLYFAWVLPLMLACVAGFLAYLRFILALERMQRVRLLVAAAIFLLGAVGVEMIGGAEVEARGVGTLTYRSLATLEEALEMLGMLAFFNFLLHEVAHSVQSCRLRID